MLFICSVYLAVLQWIKFTKTVECRKNNTFDDFYTNRIKLTRLTALFSLNYVALIRNFYCCSYNRLACIDVAQKRAVLWRRGTQHSLTMGWKN